MTKNVIDLVFIHNLSTPDLKSACNATRVHRERLHISFARYLYYRCMTESCQSASILRRSFKLENEGEKGCAVHRDVNVALQTQQQVSFSHAYRVYYYLVLVF
jgi:hypothetical protein